MYASGSRLKKHVDVIRKVSSAQTVALNYCVEQPSCDIATSFPNLWGGVTGCQAGVKVRRAVCDGSSCPGKYINRGPNPKHKTVRASFLRQLLSPVFRGCAFDGPSYPSF